MGTRPTTSTPRCMWGRAPGAPAPAGALQARPSGHRHAAVAHGSPWVGPVGLGRCRGHRRRHTAAAALRGTRWSAQGHGRGTPAQWCARRCCSRASLRHPAVANNDDRPPHYAPAAAGGPVPPVPGAQPAPAHTGEPWVRHTARQLLVQYSPVSQKRSSTVPMLPRATTVHRRPLSWARLALLPQR